MNKVRRVCENNVQEIGLLLAPDKKCFESFDNINQYQLDAGKLRSQSFKLVISDIKKFIRSKLQAIVKANEYRKNVAELEGLSDAVLKDIGVYRGDIDELVLSGLNREEKN